MIYVYTVIYNILTFIVSTTRWSRDIRITLYLSAPVRKSLIYYVTAMDVRKSKTFAFQFVKPILQTITQLIQHTVLEIQFWSVKCTTVTVR